MPRFRVRPPPPAPLPTFSTLCLPPSYLHHPSESRFSRLLLGVEGCGEGDGGREEDGGGKKSAASPVTSRCAQDQGVTPGVAGEVCGWRVREIHLQQVEEAWLKKERNRKSGDVTQRGAAGRLVTSQLTFRPLPDPFLFRHYEDVIKYCAQYRYCHTVHNVGRASMHSLPEAEVDELDMCRHPSSTFAGLSPDLSLHHLPTLTLPCVTMGTIPTWRVRPFVSVIPAPTDCLPAQVASPPSRHLSASVLVASSRREVREMTSRPMTSIFTMSSVVSRDGVIVSREQFQQLCRLGARYMDHCWSGGCGGNGRETHHDGCRFSPNNGGGGGNGRSEEDRQRYGAERSDKDMKRHDTDRSDTQRHGTDRSDTQKHDTDRGDTQRHGTDRSDTQRHGTDRSDTQRHGTDRNDTQRHGTDISDTQRHGTDRNDTQRHGTDISDTNRHGTDRNDTHRHGTDRSNQDRERYETDTNRFGIQSATDNNAILMKPREKHTDDSNGEGARETLSNPHALPAHQAQLCDRDRSGSSRTEVLADSQATCDSHTGHLCQWKRSAGGVSRWPGVAQVADSDRGPRTTHSTEGQRQGREGVTQMWEEYAASVDTEAGTLTTDRTLDSQQRHCQEGQPDCVSLQRVGSDGSVGKRTGVYQKCVRNTIESADSADTREKLKDALFLQNAEFTPKEHVQLPKLYSSGNNWSVDPQRLAKCDRESDNNTDTQEREHFCEGLVTPHSDTAEQGREGGHSEMMQEEDVTLPYTSPMRIVITNKAKKQGSFPIAPCSSHEGRTTYHSQLHGITTDIPSCCLSEDSRPPWPVCPCHHHCDHHQQQQQQQYWPRVYAAGSAERNPPGPDHLKASADTAADVSVTTPRQVVHTKGKAFSRMPSVTPAGKPAARQVKTEAPASHEADAFRVLDTIMVGTHRDTVAQATALSADDGRELHQQAGSAFLTHPTLLLKWKSRHVPQVSTSTRKTAGNTTSRVTQPHWRLPKISRKQSNSTNSKTSDEMSVHLESSKQTTDIRKVKNLSYDRAGFLYHLASATAWNSVRDLESDHSKASLRDSVSFHPTDHLSTDPPHKDLPDDLKTSPLSGDSHLSVLPKQASVLKNSGDPMSEPFQAVSKLQVVTVDKDDQRNGPVPCLLASCTCPVHLSDGVSDHHPACHNYLFPGDGGGNCGQCHANRQGRNVTLTESVESLTFSTSLSQPQAGRVRNTGSETCRCEVGAGRCHQVDVDRCLEVDADTMSVFHTLQSKREASSNSVQCINANNVCGQCIHLISSCWHPTQPGSTCIKVHASEHVLSESNGHHTGEVCKRQGVHHSMEAAKLFRLTGDNDSTGTRLTPEESMPQCQPFTVSNMRSVTTTLPQLRESSTAQESLSEADSHKTQHKVRGLWERTASQTPRCAAAGGQCTSIPSAVVGRSKALQRTKQTKHQHTSVSGFGNQTNETKEFRISNEEYSFDKYSEEERITKKKETAKGSEGGELTLSSDRRETTTTKEAEQCFDESSLAKTRKRKLNIYSKQRQTASSQVMSSMTSVEPMTPEAIQAPPNSPVLQIISSRPAIKASEHPREVPPKRIGSAQPLQLAKIQFQDHSSYLIPRNKHGRAWASGFRGTLPHIAAQESPLTPTSSVQRKREICLRLRSSLSRPSSVPGSAAWNTASPPSMADILDNVTRSPSRHMGHNHTATPMLASEVLFRVSSHAPTRTASDQRIDCTPETRATTVDSLAHGDETTIGLNQNDKRAGILRQMGSQSERWRDINSKELLLHQLPPDVTRSLSISSKLTIHCHQRSSKSARVTEERTSSDQGHDRSARGGRGQTAVLSRTHTNLSTNCSAYNYQLLSPQEGEGAELDQLWHNPCQDQGGQDCGKDDCDLGVHHDWQRVTSECTSPVPEHSQQVWKQDSGRDVSEFSTARQNKYHHVWELSSESGVSESKPVPQETGSHNQQHDTGPAVNIDCVSVTEDWDHTESYSPLGDPHSSLLDGNNPDCHLGAAESDSYPDCHSEVADNDSNFDCHLDDDNETNTGNSGHQPAVSVCDHQVVSAGGGEGAFYSSLANFTFDSLLQLTAGGKTSDGRDVNERCIPRQKKHNASHRQEDEWGKLTEQQTSKSEEKKEVRRENSQMSQDRKVQGNLTISLQGERTPQQHYKTGLSSLKESTLHPQGKKERSTELMRWPETTPPSSDNSLRGTELTSRGENTRQPSSKGDSTAVSRQQEIAAHCVPAKIKKGHCNPWQAMTALSMKTKDKKVPCKRWQDLMRQARPQEGDRREKVKGETSQKLVQRTEQGESVTNRPLRYQLDKTRNCLQREDLCDSHHLEIHLHTDQERFGELKPDTGIMSSQFHPHPNSSPHRHPPHGFPHTFPHPHQLPTHPPADSRGPDEVLTDSHHGEHNDTVQRQSRKQTLHPADNTDNESNGNRDTQLEHQSHLRGLGQHVLEADDPQACSMPDITVRSGQNQRIKFSDVLGTGGRQDSQASGAESGTKPLSTCLQLQYSMLRTGPLTRRSSLGQNRQAVAGKHSSDGARTMVWNH